MSLIRGFLLLISALIVGAFFTVWTVQRTRQIGLMKALGASNGYVLRDALGQLAVVLVAATAVGVAVGGRAGQPRRRRRALQPPGWRRCSAPRSCWSCWAWLGSLVAIRRVTSVDPVIALGAES